MIKRQNLEEQLRLFRELMDIMSAMKNLALTELRKLSRYLSTQERVVATIERAAKDFVSHHPLPLPPGEPARPWIVLVGSERGFCGGFNEAVLVGLDRHLALRPQAAEPRLVAVGRRLCNKLAGDPRLAAEVDGAAVVDEVDDVLQRMVKTFASLPGEGDPLFLLGLTVLHHTHEGETGAGAIAAFRPIGPFVAQPRRYGTPPRLHVPPREFAGELIDQYVFAALHGAIYQSLMAENRWRLRQTEGALSRMEHRMHEWQQRVNLLRQEEITEEIEEIMLSVEAIERPLVPGR